MPRASTTLQAVIVGSDIDLANNNKKWISIQIPSAIGAVVPQLGAPAPPREPQCYLTILADLLPGAQVGDTVQLTVTLE